MLPSFRPVFYILGMLLVPLGLGMTVPAMMDGAEGRSDWSVFLNSAAVKIFIGGMLIIANRDRTTRLDRRQAFLLITLSWVVVAAFAALPFSFGHLGLSYTEAYFEAMSGLTTTGSTVIARPEDTSSGMLLWRAFLQLYGGAGIIVIAIAVLPFLRVGGMQLFRLESSEQGEKVLPRAAQVATATASTYFGLVVACFIAYWAAGMPAFDAVCHAMTTVSTAGFSTHSASFGLYESLPIEAVGSLFMFLGGVPTILYFRMLKRQPKAFVKDQQVHLYLAITVLGIIVLGLWRHLSQDVGAGQAFREASFNFISILTTTGFSSAEYWQWGGLGDVVITIAMLIGACSGSTTGGIKVFRFNMLLLAVRSQMRRMSHPHAATRSTFNGVPVPDPVVQSALTFMLMYAALLVLFSLVLSAFGYNFLTSVSAAATSLGNVGGGLGGVIAGGYFGEMPDGTLWILSFAMLLGRLELFTLMVLFSTRFWRG